MGMNDGDTTVALPYPWGQFSDYVVVEPVTKEQKRDAKKAMKKKHQLERKRESKTGV